MKKIEPVRKITCSRDRLRVVFTVVDPSVEIAADALENLRCEFHNWLDGSGEEPLLLRGMMMELYELPEWSKEVKPPIAEQPMTGPVEATPDGANFEKMYSDWRRKNFEEWRSEPGSVPESGRDKDPLL